MTPRADEKHYVLVARLATLLTLVLSLIATVFMDQVSRAWEFLLMLGAGTGLVYILRWYWWRINAWSEVSAMASALIVSLTMRAFIDMSRPESFAWTLIVTTSITTVVWLAVTFMTGPEARETLRAFYTKVRPAGGGWNPIAAELRMQPIRGELRRNAIEWILGVVLVYSIMFGTGALIFDQPRNLAIFAVTAAISATGLIIEYRREASRATVASKGAPA